MILGRKELIVINYFFA